jgi:uncharacterized protein involved in response to NO
MIVGYALGGVALLGGLAIELGGHARLGLLVRAGAAMAILVMSGAWRAPTRTGANRRLLWGAPWALVLGLVAAALFPAHRVAAMHVAYVGGFGLLAFAVAAHVTMAHSGSPEPRPSLWPVAAFGGLLVLAMAIRATATAFVQYYVTALGLAAALWLAGAAVWALFLARWIWRSPEHTEAGPDDQTLQRS